MCLAPVQCHRPRVQGPGVSAGRVSTPCSSQSFTDYEIIAVDDCSPDACGAIIDEYAARDPRVSAVHLPENAGLGPARNAGIARATGDYLHLPRRRRHPRPRTRSRRSPTGSRRPATPTSWSTTTPVRTGRARASATPSPTSSPRPAPPPSGSTDRPAAAQGPDGRLEQGVPPRVHRGRGLHLPARLLRGHPLDLPGADGRRVDRRRWTASACTTASGARATSSPPPAAGTSTSSTSTTGSSRSSTRAPNSRVWRPVLFRRMLDHFSTLFTARDRLPRGSRAEFFRRARAHYRRYRTPGAAVPLPRPAAARAVPAGRPPHVPRPVGRVSGCAAGRRGLGGPRARARAAALQLHYRVQRRLPVRATGAVFAAYWRPRLHLQPAAIWRPRAGLVPGHAARRGSAARRTHHTVPTATRRLRPGTAAYWTALARSKYLVNNVNFDRRLVKRPRPGAPPDPPRHPAQDHGHSTSRTVRPPPVHGLRPAPAQRRQVGLLASRPTALHPRLGADVPGRLHDARVRQPAQRRLPARDFGRRRPAARVASASRRAARALLYAPTHRDYRRAQRHSLDLERLVRVTRPALRAAGPLAPHVRTARCHAAHPATRASSTSPATRPSRRSASPPTRWSRTTRR